MMATNFWDIHGFLFLLFIAIFPRLTMLLATPWGGVLWWIGWLIVPRFLVAVLATSRYWETNPILCLIAWLWVFIGESGEKRTGFYYVRRTPLYRHPQLENDDPDVIEV